MAAYDAEFMINTMFKRLNPSSSQQLKTLLYYVTVLVIVVCAKLKLANWIFVQYKITL